VERTQSHLIGGFAAVGAGVLHATAIGLHAEKPQLARVFMVLTLFQVAVGAAHLIRPRISVLVASLVVNSVAATGWVVTRISSVSWIDGLENRESPQIADTVCAGLGLVAVGVALGHLVAGSIDPPTRKSLQSALPIAAIGIAVVVGMWSGASHVHDHGDDHADNGDHHAANHTQPTPMNMVRPTTVTTSTQRRSMVSRRTGPDRTTRPSVSTSVAYPTSHPSKRHGRWN
jgi:choline-glycine betaine transporter